MNALFHWIRHHHGARFVLLTAGALGAYLFAVTTFAMFDYYWHHGWTGGNLQDLVVVTLSLPSAFVPRVLLKRADDILVWLGFVGFVAFEWLAQTLHHSLAHLPPNRFQWMVAIAAVALLAVLYWAFKRSGAAHIAVMRQEKAPAVEGLVLFLSFFPPKRGADAYTHGPDGEPTPEWLKVQKDLFDDISQAAALDTTVPAIRNPKVWQAFDWRNWRMPVEAIGHQFTFPQPRLKKILLIASKDSHRSSGSARQVDAFATLVNQLCADIDPKPSIECPEPEGIDFEDCKAISHAVQDCKALLANEGIHPYLIDVTGGTATCSIVAGALTLDMGEAFEYVSTNTHSVRQFDIEYEPRRQPTGE